MPKLKVGDVVVYTLATCPEAYGSIGIVIAGPYEDEYAAESYQSVDVDWISVHPTLMQYDASYNVDCFELLFHLPKNKSD